MRDGRASELGGFFRAAARGGAALAIAVSMAVGPARATDAGLGFAFDITLSPDAAAKLKAAQEGITVWASFYGEPSGEGEKHVDEMGLIDLGVETLYLPGEAATVQITAREVDPAKLKWIKGPANVNVNVYTSRKSSEYNLIDCDLIDGDVKKLQAMKVTVRCWLIGESHDGKTYP